MSCYVCLYNNILDSCTALWILSGSSLLFKSLESYKIICIENPVNSLVIKVWDSACQDVSLKSLKCFLSTQTWILSLWKAHLNAIDFCAPQFLILPVLVYMGLYYLWATFLYPDAIVAYQWSKTTLLSTKRGSGVLACCIIIAKINFRLGYACSIQFQASIRVFYFLVDKCTGVLETWLFLKVWSYFLSISHL